MNGDTNGLPTPDTIVFNEIQGLLAEKRNCARFLAHRYRRLRFAYVGVERAHRDLTVLQH
jgi:hypothetical protein